MTNRQDGRETMEQLDKILDDLATENTSIFMPGDDQVSIQGEIYHLKRNFKDAFQVNTFKKRFVDIFFDYDYIVGDFSGDLLRLRGFYDEGRNNAPLDQIITRLEDYLMESVNFGAPYFVLERVQKLDILPIEKDKGKHLQDQKRKKRNHQRIKHRSNRSPHGRGGGHQKSKLNAQRGKQSKSNHESANQSTKDGAKTMGKADKSFRIIKKARK